MEEHARVAAFVRYGGSGRGVVHLRRAGRKVLCVQGLEFACIDAAAAGTGRRRASPVAVHCVCDLMGSP